MSRTRTEFTAYAGVLGSALAVVLTLTAPVPALALIGALVLACIPAGAAVMCWIDSGENLAQAALTLILSLTAFSLASALMIWVVAWHPRVLIGLAAASAVSCLARLTRAAGQ